MTEPEQSAYDEQVSRLLADARHDAPMPADVAARMDDVLAGLATERSDAPPVPPPPLGPPAPVVDLAARRRRRQGGALLLAAAAVVAIGVGVGAITGDDTGDDSGSAGSSSDSFDRTDPNAADEGGGASPSEAAPSAAGPDGLARMRPLPVSSDTFAADAERYREQTALGQKPDPPPESEPEFPCEAASFGDGTLVPVLYDAMPAVLAYRPPTDDAQVVDLLQCGTGDVLRTTTLPVP